MLKQTKLLICTVQHIWACAQQNQQIDLCAQRRLISLDFRPVWSESWLSARRNLGSLATHWAHSKVPHWTGWMPRLICVFTGRTGHFVMPRHQKVAGYYVIPSEILSVRPSVRLSVRPSVRPSAPTTILVSATPPTVLGQSFWNVTGVLRMVWRYAYCFFRILKLFFITFFPFLT